MARLKAFGRQGRIRRILVCVVCRTDKDADGVRYAFGNLDVGVCERLRGDGEKEQFLLVLAIMFL